jgi:hypothetical protein
MTVEHCKNELREGGVVFGVRLEEPVLVRIDPGNWIRSIDDNISRYEEIQKQKPRIIVFLLASSEETEYNKAKGHCTRVLRLKTQFILTSTIEEKGLSAAGKVVLQMAAKAGSKLWIVPKSHTYWQGKRVALASVSYSKGAKNNFTVALVGTT